MNAPRMLFVYNPHAGKATIRGHLLDIIDIFTKAGYEVTAYPTQSQGDGEKRVRDRADDYSIVVCSGGDGTLDEVVSGMMNSEFKVPIGYVPAGSTNDYAKSLKIPSVMTKAAQIVVNGNDFLSDVGTMNDKYFVYCAAFGIFTDVSYSTDQSLKNALGHAAYILQSVKELQDIKTYHMKITYGNGTVLEDEFIYGMVTNSIQVGGIQNITGKNVKLDDGEFEVTLVRKPKSLIDLPNLVGALLDSKILSSNDLINIKLRNITFESDIPVAWTRDGEYGGEHTKVVINNLPRAVTIKVP
ncbi:lipid kinase, YegS/Rv2252/BmrU family [Butyrivibrio fibrisolvens DSM 3071]|uniref:Lipid kinase, YegS/Rv2252/BmrU family n=1 Tax=Butyrivibrio fibrisolvens DSM 3071 TaxID=1121131 RepID=A0A1M6BU12_BUTFI|nr:diacylglycerol kinase family protein [Butyrivibrio fibrisolvens]SHI52220.1 lipid kinase, YegS/Rv2252/BmrU family [Butyrivibrio fibrisolvens DSM 3071]